MAGELILVVEDDDLSMKLTRDMLTGEGYRVAEAWTGEDGVRLARELLPDLVLMDFHLRGKGGTLNGLEAFVQIRADARSCRIMVLALTASASPKEGVRLKEAGFDGVFTKPIDIDDVNRKIAEVLARKDEGT